MRILIANDDGIYSPGIAFLARVAARFGEARVVAPSAEQSSMAQAITSSRPLRLRRAAVAGCESAFSVDGTPSDCVALGSFAWGQVDVVLSGINLGLNVGNAMWHSGTLAAAKQAALLGIRGIALSAPAIEDPADYAPVEPWLGRVLAELFAIPDLPLLNVNFPAKPTGIAWTRQSVRRYAGNVVAAKDPQGRDVYWFSPTPVEGPEPGTDRHAVERGLVSITPLRLDLTDEAALTASRLGA